MHFNFGFTVFNPTSYIKGTILNLVLFRRKYIIFSFVFQVPEQSKRPQIQNIYKNIKCHVSSHPIILFCMH